MLFSLKKWFIFALFACLSTEVLAQSPNHFTIQGEIENPETSTIHFSGLIRCNSETGCSKFMVNKDWADEIANNRDIRIRKLNHKFKLTNIVVKRDKEVFFFFDALGRTAYAIVSKDTAANGVINVGKINLQNPILVHANIAFPDFISEQNRKKTVITFSRLNEGGMSLVGTTQLNEQSEMNIRLLPGNYTVFLDVPDDQNNWRRVIKNIEVANDSIDLGKIIIQTKLDQMVADGATYEQVLAEFDFKQIPPNQLGAVQNIGKADVTLVYFFAGYCGPCLSEDGLSKYFKLAKKYSGRLGVIGIHSDSYRMTKNCPTSQSDLENFVENQASWKRIKSSFEEAKGNPIFLSWQSAEFAEDLTLNAYPTTLIFKNGVLQNWFVGVNPLVTTAIENLLK